MDQMQQNQTLMLQHLLKFQQDMTSLNKKVSSLNTEFE